MKAMFEGEEYLEEEEEEGGKPVFEYDEQIGGWGGSRTIRPRTIRHKILFFVKR